MFCLNLSYRWTVAAELSDLWAAVLLPVGNSRLRLKRRTPAEPRRLLFDPQLYLAGLPAESCAKVCARLASYPWFRTPGLPDLEEGMGARAWEQEVRGLIADVWLGEAARDEDRQRSAREAIEFQLELGCSHIILPTPLLEQREDEAQTVAEWIDAGLSAAASLDVEQPILATVAILDGVIGEALDSPISFVETVVDQVSAREGLDGVYIPVVQGAARHPFETDIDLLRAMCLLSSGFSRAGYSTVLPNFVDVFGLVCMAFGAGGLVTGSSQSLRRLSLQGLEDSVGGLALPHYYSHRSITEYLTESDLTGVVNGRLLRRVEDRTPYSANLLDAFSAGRGAGDLPDWVESRNNYPRAHLHFVWRMQREAERLAGIPSNERRELVRNWLEDAEANSLYVRQKLPARIEGHVAPMGRWLALFDELVDAEG